MSIKRVLICGARSFEDKESIEKVVKKLVGQWGTGRIIVIEGGAPGADSLARQVCEEQGIHCLEMKALWNYHNRSAGPIRNRMMLSLEPDLVIGFHWDLDESKGTRDMLAIAKKSGIKAVFVKVPKERALKSATDFEAAKQAKKKRR